MNWDRASTLLAVVLFVLAVLVGAVSLGIVSPPVPTPEESAYNRTTVTIVDDATGESLGTVEVRIADTFQKRYTGLSNTSSLGPNEGMLFVHGSAANRTYVMRDMAFPIDIVFVGPDRRITAIHHARTESPPYTEYRGYARWVLEVPYNWTVTHGVEVGDRLVLPANATGPATATGTAG